MSTFVKLVYNDDIRRVACDANGLRGLQSLMEACKQIWGLEGSKLTYFDEDGDRITVGSESELKEAVAMGVSRFQVMAGAAAVAVAPVDDDAFVEVQAVAEPVAEAVEPEQEQEQEAEEEDPAEATDEEVEVDVPAEAAVDNDNEAEAEAEEEKADESSAEADASGIDGSTVAQLATVLSSMGVVIESIGDDADVEADRASVASSVHRTIHCDGCGASPIEGARFKCTVCPDFDLCAACEAKDLHDPTHDLLKMRLPAESKMERTLVRLLKRRAAAAASEEEQAARRAEKEAAKEAKRAARQARREAKMAAKAARAAAAAEGKKERKQRKLKWDAIFEEDVTIPDGMEVAGKSVHQKTWRIRNTGAQDWKDVVLVAVKRRSTNMTLADAVLPLVSAAAGETVEITVPIQAPEEAGTYRGVYRLLKPNGKAFGCHMWVEVTVVAAAAQDEEAAAAAPVAAEEKEVQADQEVVEAVVEAVPAAAAAAPAVFEGKWAKELRALHDMGFTDKDLNESLLAYTRGNLNKVLAHLLKIQA